VKIEWGKKKTAPPKKLGKTLAQILKDSLIKEVNRDPALRKRIAMKEAGYESLMAEADPITEKQRQIKTKVTDMALQRIDSDPELAEQFIEEQIFEIIGSKRRSRGKDTDSDGRMDPYEGMSAAARTRAELQDLRELQEELGSGNGSKGMLGGIITPDVIKAVIEYLSTNAKLQFAQLQNQPQIQTQQVRTYVVQVEGQVKEMSETEYRQLLQKGAVKPIAAIEAPKKEASESSDIMVQSDFGKPVVAKEQAPINTVSADILASLDIEMIKSYLDMSPADAITRIHEQEMSGDPQAGMMLKFLGMTNYDTIASYLGPYRKDPTLGVYIAKVLDRKDWISEVIRLAKEKIIGRD